MTSNASAFLAGDEDAARVGGIMAAISLIDIGALNGAAAAPCRLACLVAQTRQPSAMKRLAACRQLISRSAPVRPLPRQVPAQCSKTRAAATNLSRKGCLSHETARTMFLKLVEGAQKGRSRLDVDDQLPKPMGGVKVAGLVITATATATCIRRGSNGPAAILPLATRVRFEITRNRCSPDGVVSRKSHNPRTGDSDVTCSPISSRSCTMPLNRRESIRRTATSGSTPARPSSMQSCPRLLATAFHYGGIRHVRDSF
jgi:hypothetical protein